MCSIFTREEVGKDKAFTHKSQNVKWIEGRGEGRIRKVAECAMRGCLRRRECAYARGRVSEAGEQNGNEGRGTERKRGGGRSKRGGLCGETREEETENPQVFDLGQQN